MYKQASDIESRLKGEASKLVIVGRETGRTEGRKNLTHSEKVISGAVARVDGVQAAADLLGTSTGTASSNARGLDRSGNDFSKNEELTTDVDKAVGKAKDDVISLATARLVQSLGIVEDKLPFTNKAIDAASVARSMSSIIKDMSGDNDKGNTNIQIVIEGSKPRDIKEYEVIDV